VLIGVKHNRTNWPGSWSRSPTLWDRLRVRLRLRAVCAVCTNRVCNVIGDAATLWTVLMSSDRVCTSKRYCVNYAQCRHIITDDCCLQDLYKKDTTGQLCALVRRDLCVHHGARRHDRILRDTQGSWVCVCVRESVVQSSQDWRSHKISEMQSSAFLWVVCQRCARPKSRLSSLPYTHHNGAASVLMTVTTHERCFSAAIQYFPDHRRDAFLLKSHLPFYNTTAFCM